MSCSSQRSTSTLFLLLFRFCLPAYLLPAFVKADLLFFFFFLLSYLFLSYKASLGAAFVNALRENKKKKSFKAVNSGDTDFGHETALSTPACSRSR